MIKAKRWCVAGIAAWLWLAVAPRPAAAEDPPEYTAAISEAVSEYQAGDFAEARALFERAHAVMPNARTFRGLGMAEFELRNYPASVAFLEQALSATLKPLEGDLRDETQRLLERARGFVGRFDLALEPADATVAVDGEPVELGKNGALVLAVGDHVLETRAPGHLGDHRKLRVTGGEQTRLRIVLPAQAAVTSMNSNAPRAHDQADSGSVFSQPLFWLAVGAVAIGAGVGVGLALTQNGSHPAKAYGGDTAQVLSGP